MYTFCNTIRLKTVSEYRTVSNYNCKDFTNNVGPQEHNKVVKNLNFNFGDI